jgi:hypothetical protein
VHSVRILPDGLTAEVIVGDRQLSLAIGKEGQNARLAAKLTSLRIDIKSLSAVEDENEQPELQISAEPDVKRETPIWEELAAQEEAARLAAEQAQTSVAATTAPQSAVAQPEAEVAARPEPPATTPAADRGGAVRFADEVLPSARPAETAKGGTSRRKGRKAGAVRETEEQARARRGLGGRRGVPRRSLDEEIEEELEAALEDEDFDFFGLKDGEE